MCSQSPHDETVVAQCAQSETVLPLALKLKPATGRKMQGRGCGARWTRAVKASLAAPKKEGGRKIGLMLVCF